MKMVVLHCSFQNLFQSCCEVLPLLRYWPKEFSNYQLFFLFFWNFLFENNSKYHNFNKFRRQKEGLQLLYCGKFGQKRKRHTLKGSLILNLRENEVATLMQWKLDRNKCQAEWNILWNSCQRWMKQNSRENEVATMMQWKFDWNKCQEEWNIPWNSCHGRMR